MRKKDREDKNNKLKIVLTIISAILFLFFVLPCFHNWANSLRINLHFCNHIACMVYSLIWLAFTIIGIYYLIKKKEMKRAWIIIYIIILIVGIVLMNIIVCDKSGKMGFGFDNFNKIFVSKNNYNIVDYNTSCKDTAKNNCNGWCKDNKMCQMDKLGACFCSNTSLLSNCTDTDAWDDMVHVVTDNPLIRGEIVGTNLSDYCVDNYVLHEYFCGNEVTYGSRDINCREYYNSAFAYCEEGICKLNSSWQMNCLEICSSLGYSDSYGLTNNYFECASYEYIICREDYESSLPGEWSGLFWGEFEMNNYYLEENDFNKFCCCGITPSPNCTDNDGDNYAIEGGECGIIDCDDSDANINPGATEICDDLIDNNCNGNIDCDDSYCAGQEICIPCGDSSKPECGGYCPEDYTCKYDEEKDYCFCGTNYCEDSDDGFNLTVQGTCSDGVSDNIDTCIYDGESVIEWLCSESGCISTIRYCENGCEAGACKVS